MTEYYKRKFTIRAKAGSAKSCLQVLTKGIKEWLAGKYGQSGINQIVPNWQHFVDGGIFGDAEKIGGVLIESVYADMVAGEATVAWACKIIEVSQHYPEFIHQRWMTEIGFQQVSFNTAVISFCASLENISGYTGKSRSSMSFKIPNIAHFIISTEDWIFEKSDFSPDILFDIDSCRKLKSNSMKQKQQTTSGEPEYPKGKRWISLCQVNYPDRKGDIWMQRLADSENGVLIAPAFDNDKDPIFDNRRLLYLQDGPADAKCIGFWKWTECQDEFGRWYTDTFYVEETTPVELYIFSEISSVEELTERIRNGVRLPSYVRNSVLFAIQEQSVIKGVLCVLTEDNVSSGEERIFSVSNSSMILPYYELNDSDFFLWKDRRVYKNITLGEPLRMIPVIPYEKTVKDLLLLRMSWPVFKEQGFTKSEWRKVSPFIKSIPDNTVYDQLAETYGISSDEAQEGIAAFLQSVEQYMFAEDVDSTVIVQMLERHEGLRQKCVDIVAKKWHAEHKGEIDKATAELDKIRRQADSEIAVSKQRLAAEQNALEATKAEHQQMQGAVEAATAELGILRAKIAEQEALSNDSVTAIRQKIAAAQKDMAGFIADLSVFLPAGQEASTWLYIPSSGLDPDEDTELAESWEDEFSNLSQNLSNALGVDAELSSMLAAFLYAVNINNVPRLVAGPGGQDMAEVLSESLYAEKTGVLRIGSGYGTDAVQRITHDSAPVAAIQNMFGEGWGDTLPQTLSSPAKQIVWTHPYTEDMIIEPKGLYNYMLPLLSECFVSVLPPQKIWGGKRSEHFAAFVSDGKRPLRAAAFRQIKVSKLFLKRLEGVLSDAKQILDNPSAEKGMEILFGILPICVLTGQTNILKDVLENESGIPNAVKAEIQRYIEEE